MTQCFHTFLDEASQRSLGVAEPAPVALADRVHHDELDALNHVNNVSYMVWFERLRIHFMEHYDIGALGAPEDPRIVIRSGHIHWIEEMVRGQDYVVTCRCKAMRRTSMSLEQAIWSEGRLRARFDCVMVLLTPDGSERWPIPGEIRARLIADGAAEEGASA